MCDVYFTTQWFTYMRSQTPLKAASLLYCSRWFKISINAGFFLLHIARILARFAMRLKIYWFFLIFHMSLLEFVPGCIRVWVCVTDIKALILRQLSEKLLPCRWCDENLFQILVASAVCFMDLLYHFVQFSPSYEFLSYLFAKQYCCYATLSFTHNSRMNVRCMNKKILISCIRCCAFFFTSTAST